MSNAFSRFQLLKDAGDWAGKQMRGAVCGLALEQAGQCSRSSPVCLGWETAVGFRLVYTTGKTVTSSLCFSIMLTYSGSSGHTLQKPLMTLQLCNLNSLCSCSGCQEYCNPKSLLCNCKWETWATADSRILTIGFLSSLAFQLIFYVNRTTVFPYRLLQYNKAIYFTRAQYHSITAFVIQLLFICTFLNN